MPKHLIELIPDEHKLEKVPALLYVHPKLTCLKPAPWTAYEGICCQPAGHRGRCKFEVKEWVVVRKGRC